MTEPMPPGLEPSPLPSLVLQKVQRVRELRAEAEVFDSLPAARAIALRLDQALRRLGAPEDIRRPLHIALLGGTGVGKSELFNALIGKPEASPTSNDVRCYTRNPHIAAAAADRPLALVPAELAPVFVDGGVPGVVLCDTPDVDGMLEKNREITRDLIEHCDVVVLVTEPDKRANFDILREVRDWAARKRWFFVMNKMDNYECDFKAIRADFDGRLRELGFRPDDEVRLLVSAKHPERYDFARLRAAVLRLRPEEQVALLRLDGFLGYALYALQPDVVSEIEDKVKVLEEKEAGLRSLVHQAYRDGLRIPEASEAFRLVVRETVWRHLGQRCGWLMPLPVWLRCRFSLLWASFQVSRLTMGGLSLVRLVGAAAASVVSAVRGVLPLRQIVTALGPGYRHRLDEVQTDGRRVLEDYGLAHLAPVVDPHGEEPPAKPGTLVAAAVGIPGAALLETALRKLTLRGVDDEVLAQLDADVERIGHQTARQMVTGLRGRALIWSANFLPSGMLGWDVYRIGAAWWHENYLPWPFYGMALALWAASLLVGYCLLAWAVNRRVARLNAAELVEQVDEPRATAVLRGVHRRLRALVQQANRLRQILGEIRQTLTDEGGLPPCVYGAAHVNGQERSASPVNGARADT